MESDVTNRIAKYIVDNHISIPQVCADTGIPKEKLIFGTKLKLNSHEFLTLCQYLQLKPESF